MNENIDLTKILKDCPRGTKFYSTLFGDVTFCYINKDYEYPIILMSEGVYRGGVSADGRYYKYFNGECTLFPSKDQRDWSKFSAPWYKKERFDPNTLKPFDKVLVRDSCYDSWKCMLFSHIIKNEKFSYVCVGHPFAYCIPYNEDTKHLVGTKEEAPEFYIHWKD